jgi:hypothetical protein
MPTPPRRLPAPWSVEDIDGCFVVKAGNERPLVFISYGEGVASAPVFLAHLLSDTGFRQEHELANGAFGVCVAAAWRVSLNRACPLPPSGRPTAPAGFTRLSMMVSASWLRVATARRSLSERDASPKSCVSADSPKFCRASVGHTLRGLCSARCSAKCAQSIGPVERARHR